MTDAKKILITTETREMFILHNRGEMPVLIYCRVCRRLSAFLSIEEAVNATECSVREIISQIDAGVIHETETEDRHLLICETSLQSFLSQIPH